MPNDPQRHTPQMALNIGGGAYTPQQAKEAQRRAAERRATGGGKKPTKPRADTRGLSAAVSKQKASFRASNETGYYFTVSFPTLDAQRTFLDAYGLTEHYNATYDAYNGVTWARALGVDIDQPKRQAKPLTPPPPSREEMKRRMTYQPHPSALDLAEERDTFEEACDNEAHVILEALKKGTDPKWRERFGGPLDSPHYVTIVFTRTHEVMNFQFGLFLSPKAKDKKRYLDHVELARALDNYAAK